jgi:ABC-type cobalamin/Fe3+-siderophores transport system ATPase subunit
MRLRSIEVKNHPPVLKFTVDQLSDVIVLAGPNGVGKTRLIEALNQKFQNPTGFGNVSLQVEATCETEQRDWGKSILHTTDPQDSHRLLATLQKARRRTSWQSSVLQFESDRSIQQIAPFSFSWDINDPWTENIGWNLGFTRLRERFQDTQHSLFRKVQSQEKEIARRAKELRRSGSESMPLDFPDPLQPFKNAFRQLLAPKTLLDPDPRDQHLYYEYLGQRFPISSLSSGEREVINIVFDFILRNPSDCIVIFDEPELHLHPELSYKLIQTLRSSGSNNQFFLCTHSPDIITSSLDHSVIFLSPARGTDHNQAIRVHEDDETNQALRLLGQSIGIVSLGKRIVLIEGNQASLDKQVYGSILRDRFPSLVLVPTGGKDIIRSFALVVDHVLDRTIWGVDFFMLCDRDAAADTEVSEVEIRAQGRLRFLPRYHLENYFFDSEVLASCFSLLEPEGSWLLDKTAVEDRLKQLAEASLSYAAALIVSNAVRRECGNISVMPSSCTNLSADQLVALLTKSSADEQTRIQGALNPNAIEELTRQTVARLQASLADGSWKALFPGRPIFNKFAGVARLEPGRLRLAYLNAAAKDGYRTFSDIIEIFTGFTESQGQQAAQQGAPGNAPKAARP